MTVAEQAWIDNSLARLEALHGEREQAEAYGDADKLAEIDEEIASLTEVLETVADASGPINLPAANAPVPQAPVAPAPVAYAPAPHSTAPHPTVAPAPSPYSAPQGGTAPQPPVMAPFAAPYSPFAAPGTTAPQAAFTGVPQGAPGMTAPHAAVGQQPFTPPMGAMDSTMGSIDDLDEYRSSKLPMILVAAFVLIAGGVGAFVLLGGDKAEVKVAPATPQETQVITAAEVPEDTQEPNVAKGGAADRTPPTQLGSGSEPKPGAGRSGSNRSGAPKRTTAPKKTERELNLGSSRDPLSGV